MADFDELASCVVDAAKDCLGCDVTYLPKSGGQYKIRGIFDNTFEQVDPDTEIVIASNAPMLDIKLSDIPVKPEQGDHVIVKGNQKYRVVDSQEDGIVAAKLILHKVGC